MISYVVGRVEEIEENKITIEVGGLGVRFLITYQMEDTLQVYL